MKEIESWQNDVWIPNSKIGTLMYDAHYFFGWAVFEALRTYNHKVFLLDEHVERLIRSARLASIPFDWSKTRVKLKIHMVMSHNSGLLEDDEARIMMFVSPGFFGIYKDMGKLGNIVTVNITGCKRYAHLIAPFLDSGVTGLISSQTQIPSRFLDPRIKSCSRLHLGLADAEANRYGVGVVPILLDEHGFIAESSGANFLFFKNHEAYIPRDKNMLRGCTLDFVEKILRDKKVPIHYGDWDVYDLVDADEALFTSTFMGLMPCSEIIYRNEHFKLGGLYHPMYNLVRNYFSKLVGVDIEKQWRDWY